MSTSSYDVLAKCATRARAPLPDPEPPPSAIRYALVVYADGMGTVHLPPMTSSPLTRCGRVMLLRLRRVTLEHTDRVCTGCARPLSPPAAAARALR
jgi:hypothetical protein